MRKTIIGIAVALGLAATVAPALACPYTQASNDKPPQQTASAQDSTTTSAH